LENDPEIENKLPNGDNGAVRKKGVAETPALAAKNENAAVAVE
jgi:hypothetical protein